jgi:hypothetical protein
VRVAELVTTDDLIGSPRIVLLNGQGLPPAPLICPSSTGLNFGSVPAGSTSAVQSVTLTNCGTEVLNVYSVGLSGANPGAFILSGDSCSGQTIGIGGACSFNVQFAPTDTGTMSANVVVDSDSPFTPQVIPVSGNGIGSQPDATISTRRGSKTYIGAGVINSTGADQTVSRKSARKRTKVFYIRCQNTGSTVDTFTVLGGGNVPQGVSVQYFVGAMPKEAVEITSAVVAGTYTTASLAPGAITGNATLLRVQVTADSDALSGSYSTLITFRSTSNPSKVDAVKTTLTVK